MTHVNPDRGRDNGSLRAVRAEASAHQSLAAIPGRLKSGAVALAVAGAFSIGLIVGHGLPGEEAAAQSSLTGRAEFATLEETWELIHEMWPIPDEIDDADLIYGAASGMI